MKIYTPTELGTAQPYLEDPELAALAKKFARLHYASLGAPAGLGQGDFRRAVLAGKYPELFESVMRANQAKAAKLETALSKAPAILEALTLPEGWRARIENQSIVLNGPFIQELVPRLGRVGRFDRDRKAWIVPISSVGGLKRIFENVNKILTAATEQSASAQKIKNIQRWLGYVQNKAAQGILYQRGIEELKALDIRDYPNYADQLDEAVRLAQSARTHSARTTSTTSYETARFEPLNRTLVAMTDMPAMHTPVRHGDHIVVFEKRGTSFRINEDHPSLHGEHLLGREGDPGCYVYWRMASEEEIADLLQREKAGTENRLTAHFPWKPR